MSKKVTPRSQDYSRWYTDVVQRAELADYAPVKGCMVIRPYGYALWENIQEALDRRFKATGVQNAYFPLFIPYSLIEKEAEHVEGFAPQLAVVTHGGGEKLEEPLVVRPTSETIINTMFSQWIQSYRDLPMLLNQWCNVVRWEMRTRLFLRTTEFLWQEGHTAHVTAEEADARARQMLDVYTDFAVNDTAIPVVPGRKSDSERFAGAVRSYTIEAMMGDLRALQAGSSHFLGQNFARVFGTQYLDPDNQLQHVWQTSWGVSTRMVGAMVMVHGDDQGLILPPRLAPTQVIVVPIGRGDEGAEARAAAHALADDLRVPGVRVHVDDREEYTPGWKFNEWEMKGVPLRIEIGPRDLAAGQVVLVRRDTGEKAPVPLASLGERVPALLDDIQRALLDRARAFRDAHTHQVADYAEFQRVIEDPGGFIAAPWCGDAECEAAIKDDTKATIRCIPFEAPGAAGVCMRCGEPAVEQAVFARAY
ncbi:MAG: proline--tRNA ligase [Chloroflexi bacterium]|nr:proline--tRNA ligase [Chloroflexota bacterium]MBU1746855.1 proline--tRNA ligase [Chloroflexota bacterium]